MKNQIYKIVGGVNIISLMEEVNKQMETGYKPVGGVIEFRKTHGIYNYGQAVIKTVAE